MLLGEINRIAQSKSGFVDGERLNYPTAGLLETVKMQLKMDKQRRGG